MFKEDEVVVSELSEPRSLNMRAYKIMKHRIINDHLRAGDVIEEREFASELGMSRTPVREALLLLASEELVEIVPRRGIRVVPTSLEMLREVYEIITALETEAVGLISQRHVDEAELRPLEESVENMRAALDKKSRQLWSDSDERFHRSLLNLSGNKRLCELGHRSRDRIQRAHVVAVKIQPMPQRSMEAHASLLKPLREGDAETARRLHHAQRVRAQHEIMKTLEDHGIRLL